MLVKDSDTCCDERLPRPVDEPDFVDDLGRQRQCNAECHCEYDSDFHAYFHPVGLSYRIFYCEQNLDFHAVELSHGISLVDAGAIGFYFCVAGRQFDGDAESIRCNITFAHGLPVTDAKQQRVGDAEPYSVSGGGFLERHALAYADADAECLCHFISIRHIKRCCCSLVFCVSNGIRYAHCFRVADRDYVCYGVCIADIVDELQPVHGGHAFIERNHVCGINADRI